MIRIVPVKFRIAGKHYTFKSLDLELRTGDQVVVETDRGRALGIVVSAPREVPESDAPDGLKTVLRLATDEDRALADTNAAREEEAFRFCLQRIHERKMEMKLVRAEYLFDGSKIVFFFTADGRVDFRELVKDLAHHFHTRIEMRQIGVRDEAKLTGGIGICGRELCCCTFLTDFAPVSVRMAKEQGLALNPSKISGQCGRLLCCLNYEFETYCALRKALPKSGRKVQVGGREAEVVGQNLLGQSVTVRFADGQKAQVTPAQLEKGEPQAAAAGASGQPAAGEPEPRRERPQREGTGRQRGGKAPGDRQKKRTRPAPAEQAQEPAAEPSDAEAAKTAKKRSRSRRRPRRK
ncbi:hypothetical protein DESUT3_22040 [Desulfuromonas versatilis]|uniref:PSP1 C-terminal domain-containing protein n=1 Tax=Desulfuromonas versatilis TaxID=2802975 RepID=A0ABM8HT54_9BACT|nr:stage 0 sporulation family protein [Desulfuromonas versatilis]BCR05135.1 hypothetical protein DESUT3_22040 [Desulfuromonas versatilis]